MAGKEVGLWEDVFRETAYSWLLGDFPRAEFPSVALIPFENPDLYSAQTILPFLDESRQVGTFIFGLYKGLPVAVSGPKFGAPAVGMTLDVLSLTPAQTIIGVGYCGRLKPGVACGDLIVPTSSFIDEGTSGHYAVQQTVAYADLGLVEEIRSTCDRFGVSHAAGSIWSTDGILRETRGKIDRYVVKGAIAVDMESSAAFTVGRYFSKKVASILVGSDNPVSEEAAVLDNLREGYAKAIEIALEVGRNSYDSRR
jgi:purine-nucleoside phosphorylase